jgi:glycosyltransferase involved in cell wall biosynthesis
LNVLFLNHTSEISGAERSLLDLLAALPASVRATAACPPGELQDAIADLGIPTSTITGTAGSLRLHPLHTPRALAEMAFAAWQLRGIARRQRAELVHANSIRAGIIAGLARVPRAAKVVHVRDCLPPGPPTTATMRLIAASATTVVANSRYTAQWIRASAPRARPRVVYNGLDLERWSPASTDGTRTRDSLGAAGERGRLLLGVVAQLTPWKGQDTAIEALELLRDDGVDAQLLLIGSIKFRDRATRFDNEAYERRLRELVSVAGLEDRVCWLGEREDVTALTGSLDVLLLPSWQEPFGRALIEAMAMGVPVIATEVGGPPEIIEDGREGRLLPPGMPSAWARAIRTLAEDPTLRSKMGRAGRRRVEQAFTIEHHVGAMVELYGEALAASQLAAGDAGHGSDA